MECKSSLFIVLKRMNDGHDFQLERKHWPFNQNRSQKDKFKEEHDLILFFFGIIAA